MARKTMKEISDEGLTEEVWQAAENRGRKTAIRRERLNLLKSGVISYKGRTVKYGCDPTPIVAHPEGHIKCVGGQRYTIDYGRK